ncbi:MAG: diaminopimelate epimerase [Rhodospirillales bacterium]|nr:MAG: diaminopimelate epimerase [Rhodospirillales bacterium]
MSTIPFTKMHGLGNDFVVIDARTRRLALSPAQAQALADRHTGVGCDQVIVVEPAADGRGDAFMRIFNADGGEVAACGNATRCVARMLLSEKARERVRIATAAGLLEAAADGDGRITVDMGLPRTGWRDIPLARAMDTLHLPIQVGALADPVAVSLGNPHAVFFVTDAEAVPLATLGPEVEHHPLFPDATNVEVATVLSPERIRLRVWERGVGITRACGTGACAAVVAGRRRGLTGDTVEVVLDGGSLMIAVAADGRVRMTGPTAVSFTGQIELPRPAG